MSTNNPLLRSRRSILRAALSLCLGTLVAKNTAGASTPDHRLDERDALARALGYVQDANSVDPKAHPQFKSGASCATCLQLRGEASEAWRPCIMFQGKLVNARGWCRGWVRNPLV
jgi:hypothetical protein